MYTNSKLQSVLEIIPDVFHTGTLQKKKRYFIGKHFQGWFCFSFSTHAIVYFAGYSIRKEVYSVCEGLAFWWFNHQKRKREIRPLADICHVFQNCQRYYKIGSSTCIAEILVPFRDRCKFKMDIWNKSSKFHIKVSLWQALKMHTYTSCMNILVKTVIIWDLQCTKKA